MKSEDFYRIIERAKELADTKMPVLRRIASTSDTDCQHSANQEWIGSTRGELVESILCDEFSAFVEDSDSLPAPTPRPATETTVATDAN